MKINFTGTTSNTGQTTVVVFTYGPDRIDEIQIPDRSVMVEGIYRRMNKFEYDFETGEGSIEVQ